MKTLYLFLALLVLSAHLPLLAQSGWNRNKGSFYTQVSYVYFSSTNFYNLAGDQLSTNRFEQQGLNFYGEYGLLDRLTLVASMPLIRANRFETTERAIGIGDLQIQAKYSLLQGKFPLAVIVAPEFPTAPGDNFASNKLIPQDRINLPTGDGEFNVWTFLAASHSFYPLPIYASVYGGYNFRTGYKGKNFSNQMSFGLEAGYTFKEKITLKASIRAFDTQGNQLLSGDFIRSDGTSFTAWSGGIFYKVNKNLRLLLDFQSYFDGVFFRKNLYSSPSYALGLAWEM